MVESLRDVGGHQQPLNGVCIARHDLLHNARHLEEETVQQERDHSWMRRFLHGLSTQTWVLSARALIVEWVGRFFRKMDRLARPASSSAAAPATTSSEIGRDEPGSAHSMTTVRGFGPWQLFVHEKSAGTSGKPDFASLSEQYKAVSDDERRRLARDARTLTERKHEIGGRLWTSKRASERTMARRDAACRLEAQQRAASLNASRGDTLSLGCHELSGALAASCPSSSQASSSWPKLSELREINHAFALESKVQRTKVDADEHVITRFLDSDVCQSVLDDGCQMLSDKELPVSCDRSSFIPAPTSASFKHSHFQWCSSNTSQRAQRAMSLDRKSGIAKKIISLARSVFTTSVMTYQHREVPQCSDAPVVHRECHEARKCLHNESGVELKRLGSNVDKAFKPLVRRGTDARLKLIHGYYVMTFIGHSVDEVLAAEEGDVDLPPASHVHLFHIGDHDLKPWKAKFLELFSVMFIPVLDKDCKLLLEGGVVPISSSSFISKWDALDKLDRALIWRMCIFELHSDRRLLGSFIPSHQHMCLGSVSCSVMVLCF